MGLDATALEYAISERWNSSQSTRADCLKPYTFWKIFSAALLDGCQLSSPSPPWTIAPSTCRFQTFRRFAWWVSTVLTVTALNHRFITTYAKPSLLRSHRRAQANGAAVAIRSGHPQKLASSIKWSQFTEASVENPRWHFTSRMPMAKLRPKVTRNKPILWPMEEDWCDVQIQLWSPTNVGIPETLNLSGLKPIS